ncbi:unnamed protein product [Boreogadus saida]
MQACQDHMAGLSSASKGGLWGKTAEVELRRGEILWPHAPLSRRRKQQGNLVTLGLRFVELFSLINASSSSANSQGLATFSSFVRPKMAGYRIFMIVVKKMRAAYTWTGVRSNSFGGCDTSSSSGEKPEFTQREARSFLSSNYLSATDGPSCTSLRITATRSAPAFPGVIHPRPSDRVKKNEFDSQTD